LLVVESGLAQCDGGQNQLMAAVDEVL
jgi:hypothetical protein